MKQIASALVCMACIAALVAVLALHLRHAALLEVGLAFGAVLAFTEAVDD